MLQALEPTASSAVISPDGQYRYLLTRDLPEGISWTPPRPPSYTVFLMLNPSTADASVDDPTIRRCKSFARREGSNALVVLNLYGLRSTNPAGLWKSDDPVGIHNDAYIKEMGEPHKKMICAWGTNARRDRVEAVVSILEATQTELFCLGTTADGHPRHPLYVRGDTPLIPWSIKDLK